MAAAAPASVQSGDEGLRLRVRGLVQGVGFRPHVWRLARALGLRGEVRNDAEGVLIEVFGPPAALSSFARRVRSEAPPLSRIDALEVTPVRGREAPRAFTIASSEAGRADTGVLPDVAICDECRDEILAAAGRRRHYAFTNCTHCGPRYSIVDGIPYDRPNTAMRAFEMCAACAAEYGDPRDRRFHAQPIACPACGPRLWAVGSADAAAAGRVGGDLSAVSPAARTGSDAMTDPLDIAARALLAGGIVALKGVGGFHLACDATDAGAVARLRERKRRPTKPFALMALDLDEVRRHCVVGPVEAALLTSPAAPVVLLARRDADALTGVAPGVDRLGVMLPHSPMHLLLLRRVGRLLVMTSGNRSHDPPETDNDAACSALAELADVFLLHDREIVNRVDDSVVRVDAGQTVHLRRARGYAPAPLAIPRWGARAAVLATGAQSKATFCFARDGMALMSPHIGELSGARVLADYERQLARMTPLFDRPLAAIVADAHPDYGSRRVAERMAAERGVTLITVQHHHAHFAACAAENGLCLDGGPALGLVLDGSGWGGDGTIWGGEWLLADYAGFERVGHLDAVPMPGGGRAAVEPWRNVVGHLHAAFGADCITALSRLKAFADLPPDHVRVQLAMIERGLNVPRASSAGRLFDAVAAVLGIAVRAQGYEGEAPIRLEALAGRAGPGHGAYPCQILDGEPARLVWRPLWRALLTDLHRDVAPEVVASRFHAGLGRGLVSLTVRLARRHAVEDVILSGGVMQNALLHALLRNGLAAAGLRPWSHRNLPAGDGGLALGQAVIGLQRTQRDGLNPPATPAATSGP